MPSATPPRGAPDELQVSDFIFNVYGNGLHLERLDVRCVASLRRGRGRRHDRAGARVVGPGPIRLRINRREEPLDLYVARRRLGPRGDVRPRAWRHPNEWTTPWSPFMRDSLPRADSADADSRTVIESCPDGWWYTALLPSRERVVAFLTDRDLVSHRALLAAGRTDRPARADQARP